MFYIIGSILVVFAIVGIIILTFYNKYMLYEVKCSAAKNEISVFLRKKYEVFKRIAVIIKDDIKTRDSFEDFDSIDIESISDFELSSLLKKYQGVINEYIDTNEKLSDNELLISLNDDEINNDLDASIQYYNENVALYNKMVKMFPSNIIAKMYHLTEKRFYDLN